jgi:hypothetical protein
LGSSGIRRFEALEKQIQTKFSRANTDKGKLFSQNQKFPWNNFYPTIPKAMIKSAQRAICIDSQFDPTKISAYLSSKINQTTFLQDFESELLLAGTNFNQDQIPNNQRPSSLLT